jgi:nicotinamidase-related amidase
MARVWDKFLTESDKQVIEASGYGARGGYGTRPAVIVVDVNYAFTGDKNMPILESVKTWRNSCGSAGWAAIPPTQKLLAAARKQHVPVFFSTGIDSRPDGFDRGGWAHKNKRSREDLPEMRKASPVRGNDIVGEIAPLPHEILIEKLKPSAFNGTPLFGFLTDLGVNTLIITGTTTSGCVRATVLDAFSANYKITLVEECCFDRFESSHAINLFDMQAKYCDVTSLDDVTGYLDSVPRDLYDDKIAFPEVRETVLA